MRVSVPSLCLGLLFFGSPDSLQAQAPSYAKDVRPFLDKYCIQCHQGKKAKGGVDLGSYESIMRGRGKQGFKTVIPGEANKSDLVTCVEGTGIRKMPPKKAVQPTAKEIEVLRAWVNGGAKNDTPVQSQLESLKYEQTKTATFRISYEENPMAMFQSGDPEAPNRMREMFGPGQLDQHIRQAIHMGWMMLPEDRKTVDELE